MPVYLARFGALGPVKIGCSLYVQQRLDTIQSRLWDELKLLRLLDGTQTDERALHRRFAHLRIKWEWFVYSPEMMGDLGLPDLRNDPSRALAPYKSLRPSDEYAARAGALRGWMIKSGLHEHDLAALLKCSKSSVSDWLKYGARPRNDITKRLIALSKDELEPTFGARPVRFKPKKIRAAQAA